MSLLPYLLDDSHFLRPSRLIDQHFGLTLDPNDFLQPLTVPRMVIKCPAGYLRNWRSSASQQDTGSTVKLDKDKFHASLDVQQFKPEEITVKVTGENTITVEGKHEEKEDEHGHIYRHFVRKYVLPKNCDINKVESKLSSDGVLTIAAPKIGGNEIEHKEVPITHTGEPVKALEQPKAGDKK
ncbi:protein lethal(2)essential for life [Anoplophora glabripennis]|uniref:Protein lethal(2)essential for life n=1 Tax=Anoplophora glabripennis TaxID=217634 RepID=V5H1V0_ANOGL|nr:protein lethal(2)essential for life [Anoplophora glabripennis]UYM28494.1 heat shock protein 20.43 [Anoplophora glabripennis]